MNFLGTPGGRGNSLASFWTRMGVPRSRRNASTLSHAGSNSQPAERNNQQTLLSSCVWQGMMLLRHWIPQAYRWVAPLLPLLRSPRFRAQQLRAHRTPGTVEWSQWSWRGRAYCEAPSQPEGAELQEGIDPGIRGRIFFSIEPPPSRTDRVQLTTAKGAEPQGEAMNHQDQHEG